MVMGREWAQKDAHCTNDPPVLGAPPEASTLSLSHQLLACRIVTPEYLAHHQRQKLSQCGVKPKPPRIVDNTNPFQTPMGGGISYTPKRPPCTWKPTPLR